MADFVHCRPPDIEAAGGAGLPGDSWGTFVLEIGLAYGLLAGSHRVKKVLLWSGLVFHVGIAFPMGMSLSAR